LIITVCKEDNQGFHLEQAEKLRTLCNKFAPDEPFLTLHDGNLKHDWPGWWSKMEMFSYPGPVLYMDVACRPVGDLTPLLEAAISHKFIVIRDFNTHQRNVQSGVMAWNGDMSYLYRQFRQDPEGHMARFVTPRWWGDQGFIEAHAGSWEYWQDVVPGAVVSYKKNCQDKVPEKAKIVCFHGKPKPWEIDNALDA